MRSYTDFYPLDPTIDEQLADKILLEAGPDYPDQTTMLEFIRGLRELNAMVKIEALRAPRATRTEINLMLRRLSARRTPLKELLNDPLTEQVMYITWFDFHAVAKTENRPTDNSPQAYARLPRSVRKLDALVAHLRMRIAEFDKLSPREQSDWFLQGNKKEMTTRQMLYPFIQRGTPTSVETYAVRQIAALYYLVTGKSFAVSSIENARRPNPIDEDTNIHVTPERYVGPGVRFARIVIRSLSLSTFFAFRPAQNLHRYSPRLGPLYQEHPKEAKRMPVGSMDKASDILVGNKIGDCWIADKRRNGPKPLSVYHQASR